MNKIASDLVDNKTIRRLPPWMKMKMPMGYSYSKIKNLLQENQLHTICSSGNCPNIGECWSNGTATFMILGEVCTRNCKFCGVKTGKPLKPDLDEPLKIARTIHLLKLRHSVITSVDRDDLPDGGAEVWAMTIKAIKEQNPGTSLEVLIPDFDGKNELVKKIIDAAPNIISHNLETVRRLTPFIRSKAKYERSLDVIKMVGDSHIPAKSGIMLGLGETKAEVIETMDDLLIAGCKILTLGQYLAPTKNHIQVAEYFPPEVFGELKSIALKKGFKFVESGPLVRSSYHAEKHVNA